LLFLDLKKVYDSVPIYNVLMKIHHLGIRGKCYKFIENVYLSSKACVRVNGQLSKSFSIKKGVRQGCPLTPILFNLFINGIFNKYDKYGNLYLVINVIVEVFFQMTLRYVLQQDPNLRNC